MRRIIHNHPGKSYAECYLLLHLRITHRASSNIAYVDHNQRAIYNYQTNYMQIAISFYVCTSTTCISYPTIYMLMSVHVRERVHWSNDYNLNEKENILFLYAVQI